MCLTRKINNLFNKRGDVIINVMTLVFASLLIAASLYIYRAYQHQMNVEFEYLNTNTGQVDSYIAPIDWRE